MGKKKYVAYVGSYTHGVSKGIKVYDVDVEKGLLTERNEVEVSNSSHTAVSKNGKYLYSIEDEGVAVFERDKDGDLARMNSVDIDGMRGCYLATDVDGKYLYVAGYHDGKVTVVHTHRDGSLGSLMDGVFHKGLGSVAERNFRPHVNCVRPTPDNKYLCAVDNGIDQVKIYRINKRTHKLELVDILRCPRETAPRIIRFSDDGKYAYLLCELSNEIRVYTYDGTGKHPEFELIQTISTLQKAEDQDAVHNAASGLTLANDGKHLFCTTAGENTVSMFEINPEDGILTKKFTLPISGDYPKDIVIFPDDKHLAVTNHASNTITVFSIDYEKNIIVMNGKPLKVDMPNSIHIWAVSEEE
ncbi:MAG: lactonase family protein [Clostridiales bacterium]|nr:lactonase family protein [Clostridiales bacterium]